MSSRTPANETPLSLWHGLAANWQSRIARHLLDAAQATVTQGLSLQRDLTQARNLADVAAAQGAASRRMMEALVERTTALSDLSTTMGQEFAASMRPAAPEPAPAPPPAE